MSTISDPGQSFSLTQPSKPMVRRLPLISCCLRTIWILSMRLRGNSMCSISCSTVGRHCWSGGLRSGPDWAVAGCSPANQPTSRMTADRANKAEVGCGHYLHTRRIDVEEPRGRATNRRRSSHSRRRLAPQWFKCRALDALEEAGLIRIVDRRPGHSTVVASVDTPKIPIGAEGQVSDETSEWN